MSINNNIPTKTISLPNFLVAARQGNKSFSTTLNDLLQSNIESTSSFKFDPRNTALKSTQQLNVDWSQFENHCFFMSAEALVNMTFNTIINEYPFDGSKQEIEAFFDSLSGFERYVFDQFPKYKGSLLFSGTALFEHGANVGTNIQVNDKAGSEFPDLSRNQSGLSILNPGEKSFSIETHLFVPDQISFDQIVCQKLNQQSNCGFTLYLQGSITNSANLTFVIVSGTSFIKSCIPIQKGIYNHIVATADRTNSYTTIKLFNNYEFINESLKKQNFGLFDFNDSMLTIGSGTTWYEGTNFTSWFGMTTFSGSLDEFRFFHSIRSIEDQQRYHQKSITSTDDLKLYFKFNEPEPLLVSDESSLVNSIVIDSSGNSLHSIVSNFTSSLRINNVNDVNTLMLYEHDDLSPVLFPAYEQTVTLNNSLLQSASLYDQYNPNIITKLIPEHWILQGQSYEGFENQYGNIQNYNSTATLGEPVLGSTHLILSFLYMYAKFFDEIKIYIDQFENQYTTTYDKYESTPNTFLLNYANKLGLDLPPLFNDSSIEQYVYANDIDNEFTTQELSLRDVQDELLKRTLINLPKIIKSKGTLYAVKSFLRTIGIDPETSVRIREYGGPTERVLDHSRENKLEPSVMLQMKSGSLVTSPYLSGSRIEIGKPLIEGTFVNKEIYHPHGISNNKNDGLFTSGSWTFEANYKWLPKKQQEIFFVTQSLCRLLVTGTNNSNGGILTNLTAVSSSNGVTINLHTRPGNALDSKYNILSLNLGNDESIFNSDKWYISFGYIDAPDCNSTYTGSYFIRAASQNFGEITRQYVTSSFIYDTNNSFKELNNSLNTSGTFIEIGQNKNVISGSNTIVNNYAYLNDITSASIEARETHFSGLISNIRFWSRALSHNDFIEHIKNYKSTGCEIPNINFDYNTTSTGSFERLRLNCVWNQEQRQPISTPTVQFNSGTIVLLDQTHNQFNLIGTGFDINEDALQGELFDYSYISPYFDESVSGEKIRIRSAYNADIVQQHPWTNFAPVYKIPESEKTIDNNKFAIEFSIIDSLNKDIVTIFSTLESLNNAIGSPNLAFSIDYPALHELRDIYFQQIRGAISFKDFFDFFLWFDTTIGIFIEQLIPRKTNFKGTSFIIESHMLERHKIKYMSEEMYLIQTDRQRFKDTLLTQQISSTINKT